MPDRPNTLHDYLISATLTVAGLTVLYYLGSVDWRWAADEQQLPSAILTELILLAAALAPYAVLFRLLRRSRQIPVFQIIAFAIIIAPPVVGFTYWHANAIPTHGWDYILVPLIQLFLMAFVYTAGIVLIEHSK